MINRKVELNKGRTLGPGIINAEASHSAACVPGTQGTISLLANLREKNSTGELLLPLNTRKMNLSWRPSTFLELCD